MALPADYLSRPFGSFVLNQLVGSGAEAEVFQCVHAPTGLFYALRLGIEEDRLWDGPPIFPPVNGATERKTVEILWSVVGGNWRDGLSSQFAHVFRIMDSREVIPLSAPARVRGAWLISDVRSLPPPQGELGSMFSLYDEAVSMMYADAALGNADLSAWLSEWQSLSGGPHLISKVGPLIEARELFGPHDAAKAQDALRAKLGSDNGREVELAENVLLKLSQARLEDRLDWNAFEATLRCPFFRLNVHTSEVHQFILLQKLFSEAEKHHYHSEGLKVAGKWLAVTLGMLSEEAHDPRADPDKFEVRETEPPEVADDWLVVQEFAGTVPTLFEAVRVLVGRPPN